MIVLGLDPGRDKCGFAALERRADGSIRVLMQRVIETAKLEQEVAAAVAAFSPERLIEGNGTTSKEARARIEAAVPDLAIDVIDEYRTTEQAKREYWKAHPPTGLCRLIPTTMQVPPVPVDDFVAVILATRYLSSTQPPSQRGDGPEGRGESPARPDKSHDVPSAGASKGGNTP
ncbi:MAG: pre-16S rRNA-processing nuclease YqgF [Selenomonadaceae bacterium]|nr:pre-16S rRNA-processing nuclease YqgF [Selenomonadaceae bacterium]